MEMDSLLDFLFTFLRNLGEKITDFDKYLTIINNLFSEKYAVF